MTSAVLAVAALLAGQLPEAAVTGTVRDAGSGEPVPGARVVLTDLDRAALTDAGGAYILPAVPAGPQHLTITRLGYGSRVLHALVPSEGTVAIDIFLRPEPIPLRRVEVLGSVPIRGLERTGESTVADRSISAAAIRNSPLVAEPDALLALAGGEVMIAPESPVGVHIRGGAADQTAFTLDGVPIFSPYHAMGVFTAWNPDALARVDVTSAAVSPALPDALSGVVAGVTRGSSGHFSARGAVSTTQARVVADGPLGAGGGWLVGLRSGFAGAYPAKDEPTYLRGESGDLIARADARGFGGTFRLLIYDAGNEVEAAASVPVGDGPSMAEPARHGFDWRSGAVGAAWTGDVSGFGVRIGAWRSTSRAHADWVPDTMSTTLAAARRDVGLLITAERRRIASETLIGVRLRDSRTSYDARSIDDVAALPLRASTPVASLFARHAWSFSSAFDAEIGTSVAAGAAGVRVGPRARMRWSAPRVRIEAALARTHQFAQSLRNGESLAGAIFPADLYVGAGTSGIPVAAAVQGVLAADWRPLPGARVAAQAYLRALDGLLLVAPVEAAPFPTSRFATGSGSVRGFAVDVSAVGTRYAATLAYGWQRVRLTHDRTTYTPAYGTAHSLDAGVMAYLTRTSSLRLSVSGATGRSATGVAGPFEWEACNLLDRGCEFAGGARTDTATGEAHPPAYLRLDAGARKHWHANLAGRDVTVGAFATLTNVLGRPNVLTWTTDDSTGERTPIEMRPFAPLVAGIDWRF